MNKYTQDFLPNLLKAEADVRESMITETETQIHLAKQFCRFDRALKICPNKHTQKMLEKCKRDIIKLMERQ